MWDPARYERFRAEREQPFRDLLQLVGVRQPERVADLGCGTGALTQDLHRTLQSQETTGVDSSPAMLQRAQALVEPGLSFVEADITVWTPSAPLDVVFSNAALQWVDDHHSLFERLARMLRPGGVLAVQMPANYDHPSHTVAAEVALEEPFASATGSYARVAPVLAPEAYAELLYRLGLIDLHVELRVYCHELESSAAVVEWVRGTLLTDYWVRMPEVMFDEYLARYRERLLAVIGDARPYLYAFKRILLRARAPD